MAAQLLGSTSMITATNLAWTHRSSALLTALLAFVALAGSGCSQKHPTKAGADGGIAGDAGTSTDGGTSLDGGLGPLPFASDPPSVYVAKVKNVLVGLPPTDAEVQAVTTDPTQLGTLVDGWMALPQYQTKMLRFFELAFQQTQITNVDFGEMLDPGQLQISNNVILQQLQQSFAQTMLWLNGAGKPFNQAMTTQTFQMTTALTVFYALLDSWQLDDTQNGIHDAFATANSGKMLTVTSTGGPIPLSQTLDPTNANYMHWYDPGVMTACGVATETYAAKSNELYYILIGNLPGCKANSAGQLLATDFTDWRPVTINQPAPGGATTAFYDLATLRAASATAPMVLNRPYVGYFTTPAFFANWQTNASNTMRVTINQALIVGLGAQYDGTDPTIPTSTPGLDTAHASSPDCVSCHQLMDPTRSILAATFSWNYGVQNDPTYTSQPGRFIFWNVQEPVSSVYQLASVISTHPFMAPGWAQKLCYYVNSEQCEAKDPAFQSIVSLFTSSNLSWNALVKAVVTSPITTHTKATLTTTTDGETVAVSRRDHLCAAWNARLGFTDICGLDVTQTPVLSNTGLAIIGGLPSDGYGRGSVAPVLPNNPSLFYRAGTENLCEALAALVIDNSKAPAGAKTWSSTQPAAAITDFVSLVAGLAPSDARASMLSTLLTAHFTAASAQGTATAALQSTFVVACMAPTAISIGM